MNNIKDYYIIKVSFEQLKLIAQTMRCRGENADTAMDELTRMQDVACGEIAKGIDASIKERMEDGYTEPLGIIINLTKRKRGNRS